MFAVLEKKEKIADEMGEILEMKVVASYCAQVQLAAPPTMGHD
jgi:hypothetical protein